VSEERSLTVPRDWGFHWPEYLMKPIQRYIASDAGRRLFMDVAMGASIIVIAAVTTAERYA